MQSCVMTGTACLFMLQNNYEQGALGSFHETQAMLMTFVVEVPRKSHTDGINLLQISPSLVRARESWGGDVWRGPEREKRWEMWGENRRKNE